MKLRNKKTGEIGDIAQTSNNCIIVYYPIKNGVAQNPQHRAIYRTLAELNEEWEDYEEPKSYWYYDTTKNSVERIEHLEDKEKDQEIGNYFETKEEAERAVEKLKAWKRLKDKEFGFTGWDRHPDFPGDFRITASDEYTCDDKDLDLLFGGEND